jgi:hypothetical protein
MVDELGVEVAQSNETANFLIMRRMHGPFCNGLEIEIVYNMYRMRRFFTKSRMRRLLSLGPPNYAIQGTYK